MHRKALLLLTGLLVACGETGTSTDGLAARIELVNAVSSRNTGHAASDGVQTFYTEEGIRVDLENGMVVPAPVALVPCAGALARLADLLLPAAHAHGAHTEAPPGVVDVAAPDGSVWSLGQVPAAPGTYCGVEVELLRLPSGSPGADAGATLYVAPCWYPDSALLPQVAGAPAQPDEVNHSCHQLPLAVTGAATVALPEPLTLDAGRRSTGLRLRLEYDRWFDGLSAPDLASADAEVRARAVSRLRQNVLASLSVPPSP